MRRKSNRQWGGVTKIDQTEQMLIESVLKVSFVKALGQGSFGAVYEVQKSVDHEAPLYHESVPETHHAVKVINLGEHAADPWRRRVDVGLMVCELATLKYLTAVTCTSAMEDNYFPQLYYKPAVVREYVCIEMELCDNTLEEQIYSTNGFNIEAIKSITLQLLEGLGFIHERSIMHLDLKPSNIGLNITGSDLTTIGVKILDFGLAKVNQSPSSEGNHCPSFDGDGNYTHAQSRKYMCPEIIAKNPHYDCRADIWSLGVIILEMICQKHGAQGVNKMDQLSEDVMLCLAAEKSLAKESLAKESLAKESLAKESLAEESLAKESLAKEPLIKESVKQWGLLSWEPRILTYHDGNITVYKPPNEEEPVEVFDLSDPTVNFNIHEVNKLQMTLRKGEEKAVQINFTDVATCTIFNKKFDDFKRIVVGDRGQISAEDSKVKISKEDIDSVFSGISEGAKSQIQSQSSHGTLYDFVVTTGGTDRIDRMFDHDSEKAEEFCNFVAKFLHFNWKKRSNAAELLELTSGWGITTRWVGNGALNKANKLAPDLSIPYYEYMMDYMPTYDGDVNEDLADITIGKIVEGLNKAF